MVTKPVIYISSTFFDLEEHREVLISALQKTKSFEVRCMENYGTISEAPLQQCLKDVRASEFYILLLGNRYGYIPEGEQLSITNLEYKEAIGDTDKEVVAKKPDTDKCILPFLLHEKYKLSNAVIKAITDEEQQQGAATNEAKRAKLEQLKTRIKTDFTLDKFFTTPDDLVGKVFGALIPELVRRNYASLLNKIELKGEIAYRCNREIPRNQFLVKNYGKDNFIKVFIIHGESAELPDDFSRTISFYELKTNRYYEVENLSNFFRHDCEKFFLELTRDLHFKIFGNVPDQENFSLERLADKIFQSGETENIVVRLRIFYKSWKENNAYIQSLFKEINRINKPQDRQNFYLLLNIIYSTEKEKCEDMQQPVMLLDKLEKIDSTDIESWVKTYFFMSTDPSTRLEAGSLARKICKTYFPDYYGTDDKFCMEDANEVLRTVVKDFNGNKKLFANYKKLYN